MSFDPGAHFDQDALTAAVDLAGRSGASGIEIGYQHENVPIEEAGWYAMATFKGARLAAEEHQGPVEAAEALARRLLKGARCRRCGKKIRLGGTLNGCRWTRHGDRWVPGCDRPIDTSIPHPFLRR